MAKKMVRPRRGALSELLRNRRMTQVDAAERTRVDRKTLTKIDRGEQVKLETLQTVMTTLRVPVSHFEETSPAADQTGGSFGPTDTVMLRKLNAKRLAELIKGAEWRVEWEPLNDLVIDRNVRALLRDLSSRVHLLSRPKVGQGQVRTMGAKASPSSTGLDYQLSQLKAVDSLADLLKALGKHRLAVLGAEYLRWNLVQVEEKLLASFVHLREARQAVSRAIQHTITASVDRPGSAAAKVAPIHRDHLR